MSKLNQHGGIIATVFLSTLLFTSLVFGIWAFSSRQSYKNDVDKKIAVAVEVAKKETKAAEAQKAAEDAKQPLKDFVGPSTYGSLRFKYPKSWSAYISGIAGYPVDTYFRPDYITDTTAADSLYSLRVLISNKPYSVEAAAAERLGGKISAYSLPNVPSVVGIKVDGDIGGGKIGSMVYLPLRDKTIEIWTESQDYINDFNTLILPNITFSP